MEGRYRLLWAPEIGDELLRKVGSKLYLAARIPPREAGRLLAVFGRVAEVLPRLGAQPASVARDPKDDYLLAHADRANADVLVTGDDDLLTLRYYKGIWILSPAEFVVELETEAGR